MILVRALGLMSSINPQPALSVPTIMSAMPTLRRYAGAGFQRLPGGDPGGVRLMQAVGNVAYVNPLLGAGKAGYRGPTLKACKVIPIRSVLASGGSGLG